jgi:hypothetical protein
MILRVTKIAETSTGNASDKLLTNPVKILLNP